MCGANRSIGEIVAMPRGLHAFQAAVVKVEDAWEAHRVTINTHHTATHPVRLC